MTLKPQISALSTPTIQRGDSYRSHRTCCAACHKGVCEGGLASELADPELVQVCKQREVDDGEGNVPAEERDDTLGDPLSSLPRTRRVLQMGKNTPICQRGSSSPAQLLPAPHTLPVACRRTSYSSRGKQYDKVRLLKTSGPGPRKRGSPEECGTQAPVEAREALSSEQLPGNEGGRWGPVGGSPASAVGPGGGRG